MNEQVKEQLPMPEKHWHPNQLVKEQNLQRLALLHKGATRK